MEKERQNNIFNTQNIKENTLEESYFEQIKYIRCLKVMNCDDEGGKRDRVGVAETSIENEEEELYN